MIIVIDWQGRFNGSAMRAFTSCGSIGKINPLNAAQTHISALHWPCIWNITIHIKKMWNIIKFFTAISPFQQWSFTSTWFSEPLQNKLQNSAHWHFHNIPFLIWPRHCSAQKRDKERCICTYSTVRQLNAHLKINIEGLLTQSFLHHSICNNVPSATGGWITIHIVVFRCCSYVPLIGQAVCAILFAGDSGSK